MVARRYTDTFAVRTDCSRRRIQTEEENGRTGSRPLGLSGLSRMANRRRDYDDVRLSPCCRAAYSVGNTGASREDVTSLTNISGMFQQPLPPKWDARSKVGARLALIRKSRNVVLPRKYVCRPRRSSVSAIRRKDLFERNKSRRDAAPKGAALKSHHFFMRAQPASVTRVCK